MQGKLNLPVRCLEGVSQQICVWVPRAGAAVLWQWQAEQNSGPVLEATPSRSLVHQLEVAEKRQLAQSQLLVCACGLLCLALLEKAKKKISLIWILGARAFPSFSYAKNFSRGLLVCFCFVKWGDQACLHSSLPSVKLS